MLLQGLDFIGCLLSASLTLIGLASSATNPVLMRSFVLSFFVGLLSWRSNHGRLHGDDGGLVLIVRTADQTSASDSARPGERAARLLNDEPVRNCVPMPMRLWIIEVCHAEASCHLGAARSPSM